MKFGLTVPLVGEPDKLARLQSLQQVFARACNALSPVVQQHRCWNRVALHHLTYRALRDQFPDLGSQMVCNAIYSVCRTARLVYQHPRSPFNVGRGGASAQIELPRLVFLPNSPVYFDRHTLSVKNDRLSMYTLDGRVHFDLALPPGQLSLFVKHRLREVVLQGEVPHGYRLCFELDGEVLPGALSVLQSPTTPVPPQWPSYLQVESLV